MDTLAALRHLIGQPDLMKAIDESKLPELDQLLVLGVALNRHGFSYEMHSKDVFLRSPPRNTITSTMFALFVPKENGGGVYVGPGGIFDEDAMLQRHILSIRSASVVPALIFDQATRWKKLKESILTGLMETYYGNPHGDARCTPLIEHATSILQAYCMKLDPQSQVVANSNRPRL